MDKEPNVMPPELKIILKAKYNCAAPSDQRHQNRVTYIILTIGKSFVKESKNGTTNDRLLDHCEKKESVEVSPSSDLFFLNSANR